MIIKGVSIFSKGTKTRYSCLSSIDMYTNNFHAFGIMRLPMQGI